MDLDSPSSLPVVLPLPIVATGTPIMRTPYEVAEYSDGDPTSKEGRRPLSQKNAARRPSFPKELHARTAQEDKGNEESGFFANACQPTNRDITIGGNGDGDDDDGGTGGDGAVGDVAGYWGMDDDCTADDNAGDEDGNGISVDGDGGQDSSDSSGDGSQTPTTRLPPPPQEQRRH